MASETYDQLCREIYEEIREAMEPKDEEKVSLLFAANGTTEKVLHRDKLLRLFRTLDQPGSPEVPQFGTAGEDLITVINERKLHNWLATLIYASCSIEAARNFTTQLDIRGVGDEHYSMRADVFSLPADRNFLVEILEDSVDADKFFAAQAYFCPVVIRKKEELRLENIECRRLPYLEEAPILKGAFGQVYRVKIATGHFFDPVANTMNSEPYEMARKDYLTTRKFNVKGEREIMEKIFSNSDRRCENILENYGSLAIGESSYSLFMPLAMFDLREYMMEHRVIGPGNFKDKADMIRCATGLAGGLNFLHNEMQSDMEDLVCYHMDLKPNNILIFKEDTSHGTRNIWKLSDFGMARVKIRRRDEGVEKERDFTTWFFRRDEPPDPTPTLNRRGEGTYLAPESLSATRSMRAESDVWSLGCVISVVFAYMEGGKDGVNNYASQRGEHPESQGFDRFFLSGKTFAKPRVSPAVNDWHSHLIERANQRNAHEAHAQKALLRFLQHSVFEVDPVKRCGAKEVQAMLRLTHQRYMKILERRPEAIADTPPKPPHRSIRTLIPPKVLSSNRRTDVSTNSTVESWSLSDHNAFKGCEISPDGGLVAYWTDVEIMLYTSQSLLSGDGHPIKPAKVYELDAEKKKICIFKELCFTKRYLIVSTTRATFHCCVFDLSQGKTYPTFDGSYWISLASRSGITKMAISPSGGILACVLRDSGLFVVPIAELIRMETRKSSNGENASPNKPWWVGKLRWPGADIAQLSFPTRDDIYLIVRPELTARSREHRIPIAHLYLKSKRMDVLVIESRGVDSSSTASLFTAFAPFRQQPATCVVVTREKQLHVQNMMSDDLTPAERRDIKNYRVLKLMMAWRDDKVFALGRASARRGMLLLELTVPRTRDDDISVKEIAHLPGLSADDPFTERLWDEEGERCVLVAALVGSNRRAIYKITLPEVQTRGP